MLQNPPMLGTHASGVHHFFDKARRRRAYPTIFRTILNLRIASQTRPWHAHLARDFTGGTPVPLFQIRKLLSVYCGGRRGVGCRILFAGVVGRAALPAGMAVLPERVSAMRFSEPVG